MVPKSRYLPYKTSLFIADRQADALVRLYGVTAGLLAPVSESVITMMRKIRVVDTDQQIPSSHGWDRKTRQFVIELAKAEPPERRFALVHEFKHVLDSGTASQLYYDGPLMSALDQAELAANYFASCFLMPKTRLVAAWQHGIRTTEELAQLFVVPERVIPKRLEQIGLVSSAGSVVVSSRTTNSFNHATPVQSAV